jgi:membrane protein involved in colicin uptake
LGIRFEPGPGPDNLTLIRPDGERFLTYQEILEQRDAERRRAEEAERQRAAEAEQRTEVEQRADAERRRAERYAAKLRELGIEPD